MGTPVHTALLKKHGFKIEFTTCVFGPKPYNTGQGMKALCKLAEERGIDIYYGTPGEQLVQDERVVLSVLLPNRRTATFNLTARRA